MYVTCTSVDISMCIKYFWLHTFVKWTNVRCPFSKKIICKSDAASLLQKSVHFQWLLCGQCDVNECGGVSDQGTISHLFHTWYLDLKCDQNKLSFDILQFAKHVGSCYQPGTMHCSTAALQQPLQTLRLEYKLPGVHTKSQSEDQWNLTKKQ